MVAPLTDRAAIRSFWWPDDGSRTDITEYSEHLDELAGNGDLAYGRGLGRLRFSYQKGGTRTEHSSSSLSLTVFRRQADGSWRIARRMWAPLASP